MSRKVISLPLPGGFTNRQKRSLVQRQVRISAGAMGTVVLPWWPDDIAWSGMSNTYEEQERPSRTPLLLRSGAGLEEMRIGVVVRPSDLAGSGDVGSYAGGIGAAGVANMLDALRQMSRARQPVTVHIAGRSGRYRMTDLGITEIEWAPSGNPLVAEVSITFKRASEAAVPVGPIRRPKR